MEKLIIHLKELEYKDLPLVGGKSAVLRILTKQGIPVPDALVVTGELYNRVVYENPRFQEILDGIKSAPKTESINYLSRLIGFFENLTLPDDFKNLLLNRLPLLHFPHFNSLAIRPSPIYEGSPTQIISGIHHSIMNVEKFPDILEAIKIVWASMWSLKAFNFRQKNYIPHEMMKMAVILQRMLRTEYSGNAYSRDSDHSEYVKINVAWGIPDGVTDQSIPYDTVILRVKKLDEENYAFPLREEQIAIKDKMQIYEGGKKVIIDTPPERVNIKILQPYEQKELANYVKKIESAFGKPQLITWGRERKVFILESIPLEKKREASRCRIISPNIELMKSPPSNITITVMRDIDGVLFQKTAEKVGEKNANLTAPTVTFLGRPYLDMEVVLFLFNKIKIPGAYTTNILRGVDVSTCISPENEDRILQINMLDSIKINKWIDRVEEEMEVVVRSLENRVNEISGIQVSGIEKRALCSILTEIMNRFTEIQDRTLIQSAIILSILLLKKQNTDSQMEIHQKIPTVPEIIDYRFTEDMISLMKELTNDPPAMTLFKKGEDKSPVRLDELKETGFFNSFISFIRKYSYMSLYPLDVSSPGFYEKPMHILEMMEFFINHRGFETGINRLLKNIRNKGKSRSGRKKLGFLGNVFQLARASPTRQSKHLPV